MTTNTYKTINIDYLKNRKTIQEVLTYLKNFHAHKEILFLTYVYIVEKNEGDQDFTKVYYDFETNIEKYVTDGLFAKFLENLIAVLQGFLTLEEGESVFLSKTTTATFIKFVLQTNNVFSKENLKSAKQEDSIDSFFQKIVTAFKNSSFYDKNDSANSQSSSFQSFRMKDGLNPLVNDPNTGVEDPNTGVEDPNIGSGSDTEGINSEGIKDPKANENISLEGFVLKADLGVESDTKLNPITLENNNYVEVILNQKIGSSLIKAKSSRKGEILTNLKYRVVSTKNYLIDAYRLKDVFVTSFFSVLLKHAPSECYFKSLTINVYKDADSLLNKKLKSSSFFLTSQNSRGLANKIVLHNNKKTEEFSEGPQYYKAKVLLNIKYSSTEIKVDRLTYGLLYNDVMCSTLSSDKKHIGNIVMNKIPLNSRKPIVIDPEKPAKNSNITFEEYLQPVKQKKINKKAGVYDIVSASFSELTKYDISKELKEDD